VADAVRTTEIETLRVLLLEMICRCGDRAGQHVGSGASAALALESVKSSYDYLILDCPPSLGLLTLNALAAADSVLIPLQCEYYAMEGLAHLLRTIGLVRERLNPALQMEGIVFTMFDGRTSLAAQVKAEVQQHLGGQAMTTVIPRNVRLTEAPSHGRPIFLHDLKSTGSVAYLELTKEVIAHG
jgi:chromosome partitioning protein